MWRESTAEESTAQPRRKVKQAHLLLLGHAAGFGDLHDEGEEEESDSGDPSYLHQLLHQAASRSEYAERSINKPLDNY